MRKLPVAGWNIGSKTLLAERGKLTLKFTCLAGTSTCPATLLNKSNSRTLPITLLAERGNLGSCFACPIAIFVKFTWTLQLAKWFRCALSCHLYELYMNKCNKWTDVQVWLCASFTLGQLHPGIWPYLNQFANNNYPFVFTSHKDCQYPYPNGPINGCQYQHREKHHFATGDDYKHICP